MRSWLRLAALLGLWGGFLVVGSLIVGFLGLGGGVAPRTSGEAFRLALGNALLLMIGFAGPAVVFLGLWEREQFKAGFRLASVPLSTWGWVAVLMLGLQAWLPWLGLDEETFRLPAAWQALEQALKAQEAQIEAIMRGFIERGSLLANLIFISLVPGIAEELFFRGALLGQLSRMMRLGVAIWVSAFVFSLVHFQVYGFVPRVLLGAVMGYLATGRGILALAMWAHFLNNAYATVGAYVAVHYLNRPEYLSASHKPPVWIAGVGVLLTGIAGYFVWKWRRSDA